MFGRLAVTLALDPAAPTADLKINCAQQGSGLIEPIPTDAPARTHEARVFRQYAHARARGPRVFIQKPKSSIDIGGLDFA